MSDTATGLAGLQVCDTLTVYNLVDNETDGLSSACGCCADPSSGITYGSEFSQHIPRKRGLNLDEICCASHGLSLLLVATTKKGKEQETHNPIERLHHTMSWIPTHSGFSGLGCPNDPPGPPNDDHDRGTRTSIL